MHNKIKYREIPFPDGRYNHSRKQLLKLIIEAIEYFRVSSKTPEEKKMMIPSKLLARYIVFGTMKLNVSLYHETDHRRIGLLKSKINKILIHHGAIKSGKSIVIEPKVILNLRGDPRK